MRTPPPEWVLKRVLVDDGTIAADDPQAIINPVWFTADFYESVDVLEETLVRFSLPQRLIWAVLWTSAEICNGGLDQYFSNSTGMIWPEAIEGFEAIGRRDLAEIMSAAVACFPSPPARDRKTRCEALDALAEDALDDLTGRYYDLEGDLFGEIMAYIRSQPEAFYFDDVIYTPPARP